MNDQQIDRALTSALRRAKGPAAADVDVRDCVDAERLAAWSAGALSEDDAAGVERHLATCARCQDVAAVFAETAEPVAAAALPATVQAPVSRILRRWMAPLAAAAAVVVWLAWPPASPPAEPADTMARVQAPPPRDETPTSPSLVPDPTVVPPAPVSAHAVPASQGGTAATKPSYSARGAAAADQMKAVERSERLPQNERSAEPKPTPPQLAQPSTLAPPPAAPTTAPVTVPAPTAPPVLPPAATAPVMAAPPPPPAPTAPPPTAAREFRAPAMAESLDPRAVVAQFSSATPPGVAGRAVAGAGRGGGGGGANRQVMADATPVTAVVPHWRVLASGTAERLTDGGVTWSAVLIDPPAHITSGAAPTSAICWLIGRGGVVLVSTNGQPFVRVAPPTAADLASIRATNALDATVTTTDGRSFRTTDGGATWVPV